MKRSSKIEPAVMSPRISATIQISEGQLSKPLLATVAWARILHKRSKNSMVRLSRSMPCNGSRQRDMSWTVNLVYDHNRSWISRLDVAPYFWGPNQQGATSMFQAICSRSE